MTDSPKRFVAWSAVSSLPQAKKVSLSEQQESNHEHIKRHDGRLVANLVVPGESRDIVLFEDACQRIEAYAQLRDLIADRAFDVLICLNRSRLGRTLALVETIAELCRRSGILVYETENPPSSLDAPRGSMDEMLLGAIKSATSQNEISTIKYRHRSGMIGRIRRGEFANNLPYGYLYIYDSGNKKVSVDSDAARVVRLILVELYLHGGLGPTTIAAELNRRGLRSPAGNEWTRQSVYSILLKVRSYAGYVEVNRRGDRPHVVADGNHDGIISEDELEAILAEKQARRDARKPATTLRFSLCVWCATCGRRMQTMTNTSRYTRDDGHTTVYEQRLARCPHNHARRHINESKIMRAMRLMVEWLQSQANRDALLIDDAEPVDVATEVAELNGQIERARDAIRRADDAYVDGTLDNDRYRRQLERLQAQIEAHKADIAALQDAEAQAKHWAQRGGRLEEAARDGLAMLETDDIPMANAWIRRHFRIWIRDNEVDRIECV